MGKNYSRNNASGKRKESDFYETYPSLTKKFLEADGYNWRCNDSIIEPACGKGAIVGVLRDEGFTDITYFDILATEPYDSTDFLTYTKHHTNLITNPPYSLAHDFILHAKEIITNRFAMLLPLTYLQGSKRLKEIWRDKWFPLETVYVFNRYPMLGDPFREDGKFRTGMQAYAWYVWQRGYQDYPKIRWLDIDKYILKKGDE